MAQQTAVEWLLSELQIRLLKIKSEPNGIVRERMINSFLIDAEQAEAMEKEQTEISDEDIEKGALEWCLGVDETGCCNTGDDYDVHELPAFIAACKWYREQLKSRQ